MLAAEAETGRKLGVAYYRRFYPAWVRAKSLVDSGALGDLVLVRILLTSFWNMSPDDPKYWRVQKAFSGGGPLADIGSHRLDLLVDLADQPATVAAFAATRHHEWDAEDCCTIAMRMPCGAHAEAAIFGNASARRDEFEVFGTKGSALLLPLGTKVEIHLGKERSTEELPLHENVHYPLVDDFVRAVQCDGPVRCSGAEGAKTTRIIDAALLSAAQGCVVEL